jgi:hypothetical protein
MTDWYSAKNIKLLTKDSKQKIRIFWQLTKYQKCIIYTTVKTTTKELGCLYFQ